MREPLRDPERLRHILEAIENIEKASMGTTIETITNDFILRHFFAQTFGGIGEMYYLCGIENSKI